MESEIYTTDISVVMPVYNAEKYIKQAVESILNQSFSDFEFIIINDGSTDGTLAILENYVKEDERIHLISRENKGLVATLNEGIDLAGSPLIARMDADDISLPHRFELQYIYLQENPDVVCVGGDAIIIDQYGRELTLLTTPYNDEALQQQILKGHGALFHPAVMYRTQVIKKISGYQTDFYPAEDLDLWLRLGEKGKLANLDIPVIKYRFLSDSISGKLAKQQYDAARAGCEAAWKRRGLVGQDFEATGDWRPSDQVQSQHAFALKFGWWAFNYKNQKAAIFYGIKSIKLMPFNKESWRLLFCAFLK